jgi:glycerol-3-phosphate O-acyltransferase
MIEPDSPSPWPKIDDAMVAFLLDARDGFEASLLRDWVETRKPHAGSGSRYSFIELPRGRADDWLAALSEEDDAVWLQPLRIAWLPAPDRRHDRPLLDFFHGRIAEPGKARRRWLAKHRPERLACIVGDGAYLEELRERQAKAAVEDDAFAEFAANQALIALERSERIFRGARYKVPRILPGEVFANADFRNLIANVAQQRDRPVGDVLQQAERYLREMAATQTPFTLEMINTLYRFACRSHHDSTIDVDESQLERVAETMATRPVIFLISHKSMLDTMALSLVLFGANLPLPLTFGGINLNTPGLGALARRSGIIFLRRSFQDNEIYKSTFRRYIDYLIEKRFSLLWALEGTRSRTGKLLPPRFGLFNYVFESIQRTRLYDVTFIPVSVAYDQITEVEDYSIEQRGQRKKPEGITWPLRFLRRGRSRGQIHLRFGDGLTVRELVEPAELEAGIDDQQKQTLVATLAFEVAVRMNAATPITSTAIITLILLAGGTRADPAPSPGDCRARELSGCGCCNRNARRTPRDRHRQLPRRRHRAALYDQSGPAPQCRLLPQHGDSLFHSRRLCRDRAARCGSRHYGPVRGFLHTHGRTQGTVQVRVLLSAARGIPVGSREARARALRRLGRHRATRRGQPARFTERRPATRCTRCTAFLRRRLSRRRQCARKCRLGRR